MDEIIIRNPKATEESEIENFFRITIKAAFEEQGVGEEIQFIEEEVKTKMDMLNKFIQGTNEYYFNIGKIGEKIVGIISYGNCGDIIKECCRDEIYNVGEIGSLYVLPAYQGQGIGSRLINSIINYLKENEIESYCLDSGFKKAQKRWIRKFGEPYKIMKDYWGPKADHFIWYCKVKP